MEKGDKGSTLTRMFHDYAKTFLTCAKMKNTELWLILSLMYLKKIHQFLSSIKKKMHIKQNWFLFLPHGVVAVIYLPYSYSDLHLCI